MLNWTEAFGGNAAIDQLDIVWERRELEDELSVKTNVETVKVASQQRAANKNEQQEMGRIFLEVVERTIYCSALNNFHMGQEHLWGRSASNLVVYLRHDVWRFVNESVNSSLCLGTLQKPRAWPPPINRKKPRVGPNLLLTLLY